VTSMDFLLKNYQIMVLTILNSVFGVSKIVF